MARSARDGLDGSGMTDESHEDWEQYFTAG